MPGQLWAGWVRAGAGYEPAEWSGMAHFLEHMVFKGTTKYPTAQVLAKAIDSIGADFNLAGGQIGVKGLYQELRYKNDDATTVHVSYTLPF